jgi:hypothetical protein
MNVSYEGIGYLAVTIPAANCTAGHVGKVNAAGMADVCLTGEHIDGLVEARENGNARMQIEGFAEIAYTGTQPNAGRVKLSSDGKGGVKHDENGREYLIMYVNEVDSTVIIKL